MSVPPEAESRLQPEPKPMPTPVLSSAGSPPLFVKIDKYTDIQTHLQELRTHSGNMKRTLDRLTESQKKLQLGLSMSYNTLDRINQTLQFLDSKFSGRVIKTPASRDPYQPVTSMHSASDEELESYLKDINKQVTKIKSELDDV